MKKRTYLALAIVIFAILASCDRPAPEPAQWSISSEIGEVGAGADELFESVRFGRILEDGGVLVGDAGLLEIRTYDSVGDRQIKVGGEGSGPGEFGSLNGVWTLPDGRIGSWDATNRRVMAFDSEGQLISTNRVGADGDPAGNLEVFFGTFGSGDILLGGLSFGDRRTPDAVVPDRIALVRLDPAGVLKGMMGEVPGLWRATRAPVPFSPISQVLICRDSIWIADPYAPEIVVHNGQGVAARTIVLPMIEATADDVEGARAALERELRERNSFFVSLIDEIPETTQLPSIAGLLLNKLTGNVWVKTYDPGADAIWLKKNAMQTGPGGEWLVIKPTGEQVARIQIPNHLTLLDVQGNQLLAVARDELDVQRVVRLEIER